MKNIPLDIAEIRKPQDVGRVLKQLRQKQRMTGGELGKQVNLSQSKISKIETGATIATLKELELILNILHCPKTIRQQILAVYEVNSFSSRAKFRPIPDNFSWLFKRESDTKLLRSFLFGAIPVHLQTLAYREAFLRHWDIAPKEHAKRMNETIKRQDLLWDTGHSYHFIIHEAALYNPPGDVRTQVAQLDRIERISSLDNVTLGIIPLQAGLPATENTTFVLYDADSVTMVIGHYELNSDNPQTIAEHIKIFSSLDQKAHYNDEAKTLLHKAIRFFEK